MKFGMQHFIIYLHKQPLQDKYQPWQVQTTKCNIFNKFYKAPNKVFNPPDGFRLFYMIAIMQLDTLHNARI